MSSLYTPRPWIIVGVTVSFFVILNTYLWVTQANPEPPKHQSPNHVLRKDTSKKDTILLIWFWPFNMRFDLDGCASKFQINNCQLTDDRELYSKADGVLFHHLDIAQDLSNLPTEPRPFFQKWVWMLFESPENSRRIAGLDHLFNITMNYRQDADITIREWLEIKVNETGIAVPSGRKTKLACWIVSNWQGSHARVGYFEELSKYISIETFGGHFENRLSHEGYIETIESCKFYLSFENTHELSDNVTMDYITEKIYSPLKLGTVPVVLGPPRYSYERFVPSHAFIHVDDFDSPKELAAYLLMLEKDEEKYRQFFMWQKYFEVKDVDFPEEHACRACEYIKNNRHYQSTPNLNNWYWGKTGLP